MSIDSLADKTTAGEDLDGKINKHFPKISASLVARANNANTFLETETSLLLSCSLTCSDLLLRKYSR